MTEERIVEAAVSVLARGGFAGWGVNRVAEVAGVDKVLIYRYFGNLEGLLEVVLGRVRFFPEVVPGAGIREVLESLQEHLESDALARSLLAWHTTGSAGDAMARVLSPQRRAFESAMAGRVGSTGASVVANAVVAWALDRILAGGAIPESWELDLLLAPVEVRELDAAALTDEPGAGDELPTELL